LTIGFIHWYVGFEIWTKEDIAIAAKNEDLIKRLLEADEEEVVVKPKKKAPAKKKK